ncbi:hypothetical protein D3C75_789510 [compost metagenome]
MIEKFLEIIELPLLCQRESDGAGFHHGDIRNIISGHHGCKLGIIISGNMLKLYLDIRKFVLKSLDGLFVWSHFFGRAPDRHPQGNLLLGSGIPGTPGRRGGIRAF